jgi:neutral ceramidase
MAGYFHARCSDGVLDPLSARALVLESEGQRVGVVSVDAICLDASVTAEVRRLVRTDIGTVLVVATHTHTGPATLPLLGEAVDESFLAALPGQIAGALKTAVRERQPVQTFATRVEVPGVAFNRRFRMKDGSVRMNPGIGNPEIVAPVGPADPECLMITFEGQDDVPCAFLVNFPLHLDTTGGTAYSADYPAALLRRLEAELGSGGLFLPGFCGDLNHLDVNGPARQSGPDCARAIGERLADALFAAWPQREPIHAAPLSVRSRICHWPRRSVSEEDVPALEAFAAGEAGSGRVPLEPEMPESLRASYARERLALRHYPPSHAGEVQVIQAGDLSLVTSPGEMFAEYGLAIKAAGGHGTGGKLVLPVCLANGYCGYVPTRAAFDQGGYETWLARSSFLAPAAGEEWLAVATDLLGAP